MIFPKWVKPGQKITWKDQTRYGNSTFIIDRIKNNNVYFTNGGGSSLITKMFQPVYKISCKICRE